MERYLVIDGRRWRATDPMLSEERGPKWWERIEREIAALVAARGPEKTVCPSEVARSLVGDERFRELMPHVREAAAAMADRREIVVTQKGEPVDARSAKGAIRLGASFSPPDR